MHLNIFIYIKFQRLLRHPLFTINPLSEADSKKFQVSFYLNNLELIVNIYY